MTDRLLLSHAKLFASLLLLLVGLNQSADAQTCGAGTAPKIRNPQGGPAALNALFPSGDYYPSELQQFVASFDAAGVHCIAPNTYSSVIFSENSSNNTASASKLCKRTNGTTAFNAFVTGSRVCGDHSCDATVGHYYPYTQVITLPNGTQTALSPGEKFCENACEFEVAHVGLMVNGPTGSTPATVKVTGTNCQQTIFSGVDRIEQCSTWNSIEYCTAPGRDQQCLEIDGGLVCAPTSMGNPPCGATGCATPQQPVLNLPTGAQVALESTPTPPAPNTGTAGQIAPPDLQFSTQGPGGSATYNYWSPSTVTGSTLGAGTGTTGQDPGDGDGDGDTPGSISGGGDCGEPPTCEGDPVSCYQAVQAWNTYCALQPASASQLEAELGRITDPTPEDGTILDTVTYNLGELIVPYSPGPCPTDLPITLPAPFNQTVMVPLSEWCELLRILGAFVHLAAGWMAFRILGSYGA